MKAAQPARPSRRVFISYRHVEPDAAVARQLAESLDLQGHEVFIDTKIPLGTQWGEVIEEHLADADVLIALVSPASAASPMVTTEIAEAHRLNVERQRPTIIPVRLGEDFRFRYPLSAYVSRFQQATWSGPEDTQPLIARVLEALVAPPRRIHPASDRLQLIQRVRGDWIKGLLERSLHQVARIELGLTVDQTAVVRGLDILVQRPEEAPKPVQPGTPLVHLFDDHRGQLLMLGVPGAGKTTLLLELAQELLRRAEEDVEYPIPVVFTLSSWAQKRLPLHDWMVQELISRSDAPKKLAQGWVTNEQILPLLDGLDEVASAHRAACVAAINAYRMEHGWVPIVITSRIAEYEQLTERLALPAAVVVQPLKRSQIEDYLDRAGPTLAAVRTELHNNERLWDVLETPLILSVAALAYRDGNGSSDGLAKQDMFGRYFQAMFRRRAKETRYSEQEMRGWLAWLARNLVRRGQTVFFLEDVVPEWFLERGATAWAAAGTITVTAVLSFVCMSLIQGLPGVIGGETLRSAMLFPKWWYWPALATPMALVLGLAYGRRAGPVDSLRVKWPGVKRFTGEAARGAVWGWLAGMLLAYPEWAFSDRRLEAFLSETRLMGAAGALTLGVTFAAKALVSARMDGERGNPGALVKRSMTSAAIILGIGLLVSSIPLDRLHLTRDMWQAPVVGLELLGWGALFLALDRGGYFTIRHYLARLLLWRTRRAPWNYVRLLDAAVDRILMRRVGGGYIFVHRMLMEHLAGDADTAWKAPRASTPSS